ncbi:hypothetical protein VCSRO130_0431 [Vibrio cholerae]|nr:hypothetical protein VCSRO130_0431 [Vibrio cholerae]
MRELTEPSIHKGSHYLEGFRKPMEKTMGVEKIHGIKNRQKKLYMGGLIYAHLSLPSYLSLSFY